MNKSSKVFISAEELEINKELVTMQLAAKNLDKKDFFGKSDPFFVVYKGSMSNPGKFVQVKKSEPIMKTLNPTWAPFNITVRDLCNNNYDRPLKVDVYDWNSSGSHEIIGSFVTSLADLATAAEERKEYPVILDKKRGKKNYKNSGVVYIRTINISKLDSFVDFIQGGTSVNFSVAVDFTASNGLLINQTLFTTMYLARIISTLQQSSQWGALLKTMTVIKCFLLWDLVPGFRQIMKCHMNFTLI